MIATNAGPKPVTLLLEFDGALYAGDLPIQAFARRLAESLPDEAGVGLVAGMRRFLESRDVPGDPGTDLSSAQDGRQAVEVLAAAGGLDAAGIEAAYRQSRHDVARTAFAIEPPAGLVEFLTGLPETTRVAVVSDADDTGVAEVLEAGELTASVDEIVCGTYGPGRRQAIVAAAVARSGSPERVIGVDSRWSGLLADVAAAGGWTALVDRFGVAERCGGSPDAVGPDVTSLLPVLQTHIARLTDPEIS